MEQENKINLIGLIGLTVSAVLGGGIYNLVSDMAKNAYVGPTMIALIISGTGMAIFCICLIGLTNKFPELDAGIFSFPGKVFGKYAAFNSAVGYWASNFIGNAAFATFVFSALGYFFPVFGNGQNIASVVGASICLWGMHFIISRGINFATKINSILTIFKLFPLVIFIIAMIIVFDYQMLTTNFWSNISTKFDFSLVFPQVRNALASSVWVYVGIEGAVAFSARAQQKKI